MKTKPLKTFRVSYEYSDRQCRPLQKQETVRGESIGDIRKRLTDRLGSITVLACQELGR